MNKLLLSAFLAWILVTPGPPIAAQESTVGEAETKESEAKSEELNEDQKAIVDNALKFVEAFNAADAKTIASLFVENGEMSVDGNSVAKGRKAIEKSYADFFAKRVDAKIGVHIESLKQVGPNLIIETGISELINDDDNETVDSYKLIHTKQDGKWLTVSADVQLEQVDTIDWRQNLDVLVGEWETSQGDWRVNTRFEWVADGNFLKREFTVYEGDEQTGCGTQVIGWEPVEGVIAAWTFTSDGGHGRAIWRQDGNQWTVEGKTTTPDGSVISVTNILTFLNADVFRFQSTERSIDGAPLADSDPVRVVRVDQDEQVSANEGE